MAYDNAVRTVHLMPYDADEIPQITIYEKDHCEGQSVLLTNDNPYDSDEKYFHWKTTSFEKGAYRSVVLPPETLVEIFDTDGFMGDSFTFRNWDEHLPACYNFEDVLPFN